MKKHLETIEEFVAALNLAQREVSEMLMADMDEEDLQRVMECELDEVILTLTTIRLKNDFSFAPEIIEIIGADDELFQD